MDGWRRGGRWEAGHARAQTRTLLMNVVRFRCMRASCVQQGLLGSVQHVFVKWLFTESGNAPSTPLTATWQSRSSTTTPWTSRHSQSLILQRTTVQCISKARLLRRTAVQCISKARLLRRTAVRCVPKARHLRRTVQCTSKSRRRSGVGGIMKSR